LSENYLITPHIYHTHLCLIIIPPILTLMLETGPLSELLAFFLSSNAAHQLRKSQCICLLQKLYTLL